MGILDLIFPKSCLECSRPGGYVCDSCIGKVRIPRPVCPICLRPSFYGKTHKSCSSPSGLDGLVSLWVYGGVIRKAILALKYKFATQIAAEISSQAIRRLRLTWPLSSKNSVLVPIPLYWYKKNTRGFNQAEEVGKLIAKGKGWDYKGGLLAKKISTNSQTELNRVERTRNIREAFGVSSNQNLSPTSKVILFDDVWTTGSTLKEGAKVLKESGVKKVWGLTLARG